MSLANLSSNDQIKLKQFIDAAEKHLQHISDEQESLKDLAKALAEEFECKPAVLMKSARSAFKANHQANKAQLDEVEAVLAATGRI